MPIYDIVMLIVVVGATVFGAWKGMAWQLASLSSIFVSYAVAYRFREPVAARIDAQPPWDTLTAMLILYLGTSLLIWIAFRLVSRFIDRVKLTEFDRHVGAVFGAVKGVVLCILITLFAVTLMGPDQRRSIIDSRSGFYIARLLNEAHTFMPEEVHEILHPYMHRLDERLDASDLHHHATSEPASDQPGGATGEWRASTDDDRLRY